MKKLFTLLVAMVITTMVFGQINQRPIYQLDEPVTMDVRSDWVGWGTSQYYTTYDPEDIYITRLNSFSTNLTGRITKVKFYWRDTYADDNNVEQPADPEFDIKIYTGGNINWVSPVANVADIDNAGRATNNAADMGTEVYTQHYVCSEAGWQEVTLTTPYTITGNEGEIWIGIYCNGTTTGLINCEATPGTDWGNAMLRYESASNGTVLTIPLYYYNAARTQITTARYCLLAYVDDGQPYQPKSDWKTEIYDPEDNQQYPDEITWLQLDQYADSLYFYGGAFNMGMDASYGMYYLSLYAQVEGGQPVNMGMDEEPIFDADSTYEQYYGMRMGPIALMGVDEFADFGLSYPFQLCFDVRYVSNSVYNGVDPNLANNHYCITVSDQEDPTIGITENTSALTVSPNPASTEINVENAAGAQISVYNVAGQKVISVENAEANETLNVSNLNAGLYIIRVVNGNEVSTAKVSIVR